VADAGRSWHRSVRNWQKLSEAGTICQKLAEADRSWQKLAEAGRSWEKLIFCVKILNE